MAAYDNEQDPYWDYQPRSFNSGNLPAPVRGAAPLTSTFDKPPVRGIAPSGPPTSVFDKPPVRGGDRASASPLTSEFDKAPVRERAKEPVTPPVTSRFDEPPVRVGGAAPAGERAGAGGREARARLPQDDLYSANVMRDSGETPIMDQTSSAEKGHGPFARVVADLVLRFLTSLCLIVALALFARLIRDIERANEFLTSPTYALTVTIIGVLYSFFELASAIFHLAKGTRMLPIEVSRYISYIGDQVFMCLFLSAGSAMASFLIALGCTYSSKPCQRAAGGVVMEFIAFAFIAIDSVLSTFCFYKKID